MGILNSELDRMRKRESDLEWEIERLTAEVKMLRKFVAAYDEMDEWQPYDSYYSEVIQRVWDARDELDAASDNTGQKR